MSSNDSETKDCKCDTCEANEIKIKMLLKNTMWMQDLLSSITNGSSNDYFKACRDVDAVIDTPLSGDEKDRLCGKKQEIKSEIGNKFMKLN